MTNEDEYYTRGAVAPAYTGELGTETRLTGRMPEHPMDPDAAYRYIHDEIDLDGNARLNLATFVSTWMEPQAEKLMSESFNKNSIDKDEYPATAAIEQRTISMVADLFNAPDLTDDPASATGASTIGSSEAAMLAGLAMKWRWRLAREKAGKDGSKPNFVMNAGVQVCWEKFCRYFDVEPRYLDAEPGRYVITPDQVEAAVDENTIGVVVIIGHTYTGEFEPIDEISARLDKIEKEKGLDIPIHIDAASGGFVAAFLHPDLKWDFRNPRVASINTSGHKYGLAYPGIGFVIWRNKDYLPDDLVFYVSYLGGSMPTMTLNFSRPGQQIIAMYYNLLRFGRGGYQAIMDSLAGTAQWFAKEIGAMEQFELVADGTDMPIVTWVMKDDSKGYTVYDISHELRAKGWQVPAYPFPPGAEMIHGLRVVLRHGLSGELAAALVQDIKDICERLEKSGAQIKADKRHFAH